MNSELKLTQGKFTKNSFNRAEMIIWLLKEIMLMLLTAWEVK